jgi:hypothetical protein
MGRLHKQRCTVAVACRHAQASLALQREGQNGTGSKPLNSLTPPPCMHACRGPVVLPAPGQKPVRPAVRTVRCPQSGPGPRQPQASAYLRLPSPSAVGVFASRGGGPRGAAVGALGLRRTEPQRTMASRAELLLRLRLLCLRAMSRWSTVLLRRGTARRHECSGRR